MATINYITRTIYLWWLQVVNKWIKEYKNSLDKEEVKDGEKEEEEDIPLLKSPALEQEQHTLYDRNTPPPRAILKSAYFTWTMCLAQEKGPPSSRALYWFYSVAQWIMPSSRICFDNLLWYALSGIIANSNSEAWISAGILPPKFIQS